MKTSASIPKGTRDFLPNDMQKRNFLFNTLRETFELFGFLPIETPAMENLSTLLGKYGEEGDKLLFKILNSGEFKQDINLDDSNAKISTQICEKGLRYDLTVPFARFVVQHQNDINFPFKRHQIQPVWRADRPQKGRYREFMQCDVDSIGSTSLLNEAELIKIIETVFKKLNINVLIKINNRKLLSGIAEIAGQTDKIIDLTVAIDKIDKIGIEKVNEELELKGFSTAEIEKLQFILKLTGTNEEKLAILKENLKSSETAMLGITEIEEIFSILKTMKIDLPCKLDLTLARGLNYYTGAIFEVVAQDVQMGSICGGGRYDNLTGIFGLKNMSGVGVSFGADRIYDVMKELNLFPTNITSCQYLFVNFGEEFYPEIFEAMNLLRSRGQSCMLYPEKAKIQKQFSFADSNNIPFVAIIGENEKSHKTLSIKNLSTGIQEELEISKL